MSGPGEVAGEQLRAIVERIEHIEEEIRELTEGKKEIYFEAKGKRLRRQNPARSDPVPQAGPEGARRAGVTSGRLSTSNKGGIPGGQKRPDEAAGLRQESRHCAPCASYCGMSRR